MVVGAADGLPAGGVLATMFHAALPHVSSMGREAPTANNQVDMGDSGARERVVHVPWHRYGLRGGAIRTELPRLKVWDRDPSSGGRTQSSRQSTIESRSGTQRPNKRNFDLGRQNFSRQPSSKRRKLGVPEPGRPEEQRNATQEEHPTGTGSDGEGCKPKPSKKELREKLETATKKAKDRKWVAAIKKEFVAKFFAKSTWATKNTKRKKIIEIMENLGGVVFPLDTDRIVEVASVLDSTGMRAADQYLAEAKAMHLEEGHEWTTLLETKMSMCKRAMARNRGPEERAKEVTLHELPKETWEEVTRKKHAPKRVAWSYAWALIWMLRSTEAAGVKKGHVKINGEKKEVSLLIPVSKTDQRAAGTRRTLKCCGLQVCSRYCPFDLAQKCVTELPQVNPDEPMFPDFEGRAMTRLQLIAAWAGKLDQHMSGHSARRSGAMYYTRQNMSIETLSFLGRWRSSAVFRYVEEALVEVPLNQDCNQWKSPRTPASETPAEAAGVAKELQAEKTVRRAARKVRAARPKSSPRRSIPEDKKTPITDAEGDQKVWAISRQRGKVVAHNLGQAAWGIPLEDWTTICGWHFAKRNVKVELTKTYKKNFTHCEKCKKIMEERDGVKRAREWAHVMNLDATDTRSAGRNQQS
eukprot:Skav201343  [mRNA]  locus=scaffold1389:351053:352966:+ [translate_table: standard]